MISTGTTPSRRIHNGGVPASEYPGPNSLSTQGPTTATPAADTSPRTAPVPAARRTPARIAPGSFATCASNVMPTETGMTSTAHAIIHATYQYALSRGDSTSVTTTGIRRLGARSTSV